MSCMVMNPEPLAALANAVETRLNCDFNYWGFEAPDSLYRELEDCMTSVTYFAEDIYRKLYALNIRAVHHGPEYREHGFAVRPWHYQLAKLLDFWLYQTAEDATVNDPLRLAMKEFRDGLYQFIVLNSPEYFNVRWGELPHPAETEE